MKIHISLSRVPLSLARKYVAGWNKTRYRDLFTRLGAGGSADKYRIYIPLGASVPAKDNVEVPPEILEYLAAHKMVLDSWSLGTVILPDGKRTARLGKVLSKEPKLKQLFDNHASRATSKAGQLITVISRHPYDIIGMSFDRGWTSCMDLHKGSNKHYLKADVKHGTLVAYLIKADDKNINKPLARITIRPFTSKKKQTLLVPGPTYGTGNRQFEKAVLSVCTRFNEGLPSDMYKLSYELYDDLESDSFYHIDPNSKTRLTYANALSAASNPVLDPSMMLRLARLRQPKSDIEMGLAENPNVTPDVLAVLAKSTNFRVTTAVGRHPRLPRETMLEMARSKNPALRTAVCLNPTVPYSLLDELSTDKSMLVKKAVAEVAKDLRLLTKLAKDPDMPVVEAVAENKNTNTEILESIVNSELASRKFELIYAVLGNPRAPQSVLLKYASDDDLSIRRRIASNTGILAAVQQILVGDESWRVRSAVAANPRVTPDILLKLSTDDDINVLSSVACAAKDPQMLHSMATTLVPQSHIKVHQVIIDIAQNQHTGVSTLRLISSYPKLVNRDLASKIMQRDPAPDDEVVDLLLEHNNPEVTAAVAQYSTNLHVLERLSKSSVGARRALTTNDDLPYSMLELLASDKATAVRADLIDHPSMTQELLQKMTTDKSPEVRERARNKLTEKFPQ